MAKREKQIADPRVNKARFAGITHMQDDVGVYCNSQLGRRSRKEDVVTCLKCLRLLKEPGLLINKRKAEKRRLKEATA